MQHARMYLQLAEGSGESGPDQRSHPRRAMALLCLMLVVLAVPAFSVTAAFADSGPGSDGAAVREDNSGPGSSGDDDDDDEPTSTGTGDSATTGSDTDGATDGATDATADTTDGETGASDDTGATGNEGSPVAVAAQNRAAARCANAKQAARRAAKASTRKQKLRKARASAACRRAAR